MCYHFTLSVDRIKIRTRKLLGYTCIHVVYLCIASFFSPILFITHLFRLGRWVLDLGTAIRCLRSLVVFVFSFVKYWTTVCWSSLHVWRRKKKNCKFSLLAIFYRPPPPTLNTIVVCKTSSEGKANPHVNWCVCVCECRFQLVAMVKGNRWFWGKGEGGQFVNWSALV